IPDPSRAVVKKEVIAVEPVLGFIILMEELHRPQRLFRGKVQYLLPYASLEVLIMENELFIGADTQHIIQLSTGKLEVEIRGIKVKCSIVEDQIPSRIPIQHSDGIVPKGTIKFISRVAGQKTYPIVLGIYISYSK